MIGTAPWKHDELVGSLPAFWELYETRPILHNDGGMRTPQLFAVWSILRALEPELVVESGVWKGLSTWLIEKACPSARVISIDIDLFRRE